MIRCRGTNVTIASETIHSEANVSKFHCHIVASPAEDVVALFSSLFLGTHPFVVVKIFSYTVSMTA